MFVDTSLVVHKIGVAVLLLSSVFIIFDGLFVQLYICPFEIHQLSVFENSLKFIWLWICLNVQVQQKAIEVVTHIAQTATNFSKRCVVLCLAGECLPWAIVLNPFKFQWMSFAPCLCHVLDLLLYAVWVMNDSCLFGLQEWWRGWQT